MPDHPNIWTWTHNGKWWGHVVWPEDNRADAKEGPFESEAQAVACIADANWLERPKMDARGQRVRRKDEEIPLDA